MDFKKNVMLILVIVIAVSFFLPWISVESAAVGNVAKLLTGKKQEAIVSVSGFKVPVLANSEESRLMITIIKIFQPDITNADKKSFLIWGVPLLAVVIFLVSRNPKTSKWVRLGFGVLGVLIFVVATFKIFTTDLDKVVMKVRIGYGLWMILFGYLGIGIIQIREFFKLKKSS